jgi:hypothetical protein
LAILRGFCYNVSHSAVQEEAPMERQVELKVGGKTVPLNPFVRKVILNTVLGLIRSLKKVRPEQEILLSIGPQEEP